MRYAQLTTVQFLYETVAPALCAITKQAFAVACPLAEHLSTAPGITRTVFYLLLNTMTSATAPSNSSISQSRIWALAWPVMLSNITVPLLGLVDSAVLGHLPDAVHLGAVAVGAQVFTLLFWSFGFLRTH